MAFVLFHGSVDRTSTNIPYQKMQNENNLRIAEVSDELNLKYEFDLTGDGKLETISIYSTLGQQIGKEYTNVFINKENEPAVSLIGYFKKAQNHDMGVGNGKVLEINTISGKSINTTFYAYENGILNNIHVSTAKPPAFFGTVSRNFPELKDLDNDTIPELLVYYRHFPSRNERTVEVYKFYDQSFVKIKEFEEMMSELYF